MRKNEANREFVARGGSCSVYHLKSSEGKGGRCIKYYNSKISMDHLEVLEKMKCPRGVNVPMVYAWTLVPEMMKERWSDVQTAHERMPCHSEDIQMSDQAMGLIVEEEWIEGKTLASLISESPLVAVTHTGKWAIQLASTLTRLHEYYGFVHHDIKPENVMIDQFGDAVLIDFDAARCLNHLQVQEVSSKGTYGFASPEAVLYPEKFDARTDLYGFGRLFLEIVDLGPHIFRPAVHALFRKCVRLDPASRFENASALLEALKFVFHEDYI